jgi:hypothetical protein
VQGEAPARRKVPETCRNGFWRKAASTRSGRKRMEQFLAKSRFHAQWREQANKNYRTGLILLLLQ